MNQDRKEDIPEEQAAAEEAPEEEEAPEAQIAGAPEPSAAAERESLEREIAELKDRLLRAVAETENVRRRAEREKADTQKYAIADFARDLLSVADNMRRAVESVSETAREGNEDVANLLEGVGLTERELLKTFERHGISKIEPLGQRLDPNLHQAMLQVPTADAEAGTVVQVLQTGYVIHDRLLRAAMVGVAAPAEDGAGGNGESGRHVDTKA